MKINSVEFEISAVKKEQYPETTKKEIVLLGRSNVGKSTFINKFTNRNKLAYTSSTPGKTQVINFFVINEKFYLVDVPGYGYAKVSKKQREEFGQMIESYLQHRENLALATLLVDFKVGPTKDDILMYEYLSYYQIPTVVLATKKDKVKKSLITKHTKDIMNKLPKLQEQDLIIYSKEDHTTLNKVYEYYEQILTYD
ncbi:MAG: ribosome biogenesis GTP-binding protein YihA/YsxC [Mycoplasmatales bacterium]